MDAHGPVADISADFSEDGLGLLSEGRQEEQTALDLLRLRLDTITAKLSRLEVAFHKQRVFWRREVGYAAIIGALLMLSGLLGFSLVWRLL
jgi:hypothetical protein